MTPLTEFRPRGPDRRRQARGGRRTNDVDGFAPLVLLVGEERAVVAEAEAILVKLKFAVSTSTSIVDALHVLPDLRPDIVVVDPRHEPLFQAATNVPVVPARGTADALITDIRRALRVTPIR